MGIYTTSNLCTYPLLRYGEYWLRFYSASLSKIRKPAQTKVTKALLPHHSVPRLGSVYPNADPEPWAAATGHPWPGAANPASCRVAHASESAFGQRDLTGCLRSKSKARRHDSRPGCVSLPIFCRSCRRLRSGVSDKAGAGWCLANKFAPTNPRGNPLLLICS